MNKKKEFLAGSQSRIIKKYEERMKQVPAILPELECKIAACEADVALALKYLYATMPYSDMGNYPLETFLDFAAHGVLLWYHCEAVRELPEEIFLNYVLHHRVNEEEIAPCRSFFYQQLKGAIAKKDVKAAALEVNYWCAQEVTYQTTDDRTASAMTVYRRGSGRCGEESNFAVNALRSVGIPARQVYAPRWSHCDDNHAWVEVLSGGRWYYLGACEPAEILNAGWFTSAASRAMMIHSRSFDDTKPNPSVIGKEGMVTILNQLGRYAETKTITVVVRDDKGQPKAGAEVYFEVMNYSAYSTIAHRTADQSGQVQLTTGLGSLHIHAIGDGLTAEGWIDTNKQDQCALFLQKPEVKEEWQSADIIAPVERPVNTDTPTKEQKGITLERLSAAAAHRRAKIENWSNPEGEKFLTGAGHSRYRRKMLAVLTDKDQVDLDSQVLEEHLQHATRWENHFPEEIFVSYILNPRVDDEVLSKYRGALDNAFSKEEKARMRQNPREIWQLIQSRIKSCPSGERESLITAPAAALKLGIASRKSQEVLFVATARTLGIPARLNPQDRSMEYLNDGMFLPVFPETMCEGTLILKSEKDFEWNYFQNFSIARLTEGHYQSLQLSHEQWKSNTLGIRLKPGRYRLLTSNRMPNGNLYAYRYDFCIAFKQQKEVALKIRKAKLADMLVCNPLPDFTLRRADGSKARGIELMKKTKHIFMFLEEGEEPTEHILNEMLELKEGFAPYSSQIIFVVRSADALADPNISRVQKTFANISTFYDSFTENPELLGRRMYVDFEQLPLIIMTDQKGNGIYAASGYNVGTGNMLLKLMAAEEQ